MYLLFLRLHLTSNHKIYIQFYKRNKYFLKNIKKLHISKYLKLSETFIREFQDRVDWEWISYCQILSEDFIREFQEDFSGRGICVDWKWISRNQKLSEDFIREFHDCVNWDFILQYQNLSHSTSGFATC